MGENMQDNFEGQPGMFTTDQKMKLIQLINEGMQVLHEIDTLRDGLNETVGAIAEELNIKKAVLTKAIKVAHKAEFDKTQKEQELLETILTTAGKTI
jgi:hypothetical protein